MIIHNARCKECEKLRNRGDRAKERAGYINPAVELAREWAKKPWV